MQFGHSASNEYTPQGLICDQFSLLYSGLQLGNLGKFIKLKLLQLKWVWRFKFSSVQN